MKWQLRMAWLVLKTAVTHPFSNSVIYEENGRLYAEQVKTPAKRGS